jgi:hypothetical protein
VKNKLIIYFSRTLGSIHNNIYKHYIKLQSINTFKNTYIELLKKYLKKTKFNTLDKVYTVKKKQNIILFLFIAWELSLIIPNRYYFYSK